MTPEIDAAVTIVQIVGAGGAWGLFRYGFTRIDPTKPFKEQFDLKKFGPTLLAAALIGVIVAATGAAAPDAGALVEPYAALLPVIVDLAISYFRKLKASRGAAAA